MKKFIIHTSIIIFISSCVARKSQYGPYQVAIPKGFKQLSREQADLLVRDFAGGFKNATFYDYYLNDSVVVGISSTKNKSPDFDVKKQAATNHEVRLRNAENLTQVEEKYDGYSVEQEHGREVVHTNYHSAVDGNLKYYKGFLTQDGDDVIKGLVIFSKADSIKGQKAFNDIINGITLKPRP